MPLCLNCGSVVSQGDILCPSCGRNPRENPPGPDEQFNIRNEYASPSHESYPGKDWRSILEQGRKCLELGKAYTGKQQRAQARREYQRAYGYFEDVLRIEPNSQEAREGKSQCLRKMV